MYFFMIFSVNYEVFASALQLDSAISFEKSEIPSGWYAAYGGNISLSTDCAYSGTQSLMMENRSQSWHSPAINIYDTLRANGQGRYKLSVWVRTNEVTEDNRCRLIVRSDKTNSFIPQNGSNFFKIVSSITYADVDTWYLLTGTIDVKAIDLIDETGQINLMIDLLDATENQKLYIDNVSISKLTIAPSQFHFVMGTYYMSPYDTGYTQYVDVIISPEIADTGVYYTSSDTNVVTVNMYTGQLAARNAGVAVITAHLPGTTYIATCLVRVEFTANICYYYDDAFQIRYSNGVSSIATMHSNLDSALYGQLGLRLYKDSTSHYHSSADICKGVVNSSNINNECTSHLPTCSDRNSQIYKIKSSGEFSSIQTHVFFFGNKYRSGACSVHTNYSVQNIPLTSTESGCTCSINRSARYQNYILMIDNNETNVYNSYGTLAHEVAHTIGAKDHYHEMITNADGTRTCKFKDVCSQCGKNARPFECLMYTSSYPSTVGADGNYFCNACKTEILQHLHETQD